MKKKKKGPQFNIWFKATKKFGPALITCGNSNIFLYPNVGYLIARYPLFEKTNTIYTCFLSIGAC